VGFPAVSKAPTAYYVNTENGDYISFLPHIIDVIAYNTSIILLRLFYPS